MHKLSGAKAVPELRNWVIFVLIVFRRMQLMIVPLIHGIELPVVQNLVAPLIYLLSKPFSDDVVHSVVFMVLESKTYIRK